MGVDCVLPKNRVPQSPSVRGGKTAGRPPTPGLLLRDSVILAVGLSFSACLMGIGAASTREYTEHFQILRWQSWKQYRAHNFQTTHLQVGDIVGHAGCLGGGLSFGAVLGSSSSLPRSFP